MAKGNKPTGTSRIKLIVLDAEVADDQIHTLTTALTNALRPAAPALRRLPPSPPQLTGGGEPEQEEMDFDSVDAGEEAEVIPPKKPKSNGVRKAAPTPDILPIDFNAYEVPLTTFVADYKPESHLKRYLLAAAWFYEHGGVQKVTPAHIYSVYRWLKWPTDVKDFSQPLRDLKAQQFFTSSEKGTYTLHHLGLQRVAEMKNGSGGDAA
ncbi:protein of unknown function [Bradyrhizobium sp. ORS 285]|uniref:hypothetical protein n=1 Tax=Bradyrhizobium sp. ORS 285 TaxID=115808 RepID=UPI000240614D|nr:hypothetical protein [Bradyrhizobium sp. ORS 285]CCD84253.1 hypothetical protein BRAO285_1190003 [Bradyrhizobium sp. ORS 285]SMX61372.1 protein of unknown function [Bradyrhizobium sp. ORS 285]